MSTIARKLHLVDGYGISTLGAALSVVFGCLALAGVLIIGITLGGRAYGRTTCANWGSASGITTKFQVLNWADSGTCLARTPSGQWVLNSKWEAFVTGTTKP